MRAYNLLVSEIAGTEQPRRAVITKSRHTVLSRYASVHTLIRLNCMCTVFEQSVRTVRRACVFMYLDVSSDGVL